MSLHIDYEKLLENHKTVWTQIEDLKNIELNVLPVYDDRYIKNIIRTYVDKVYTNFRSLNEPEGEIELFYSHFTVISIDSLLVYENKYSLQENLDSCDYKIVDK